MLYWNLLTAVDEQLFMKIRFPLVSARNQQVQQGGSAPAKYTGPIDVAKQLYKSGGIRSLYKGTIATLLRASAVDDNSLARLPIPGGLDSSESYKLILSVRVRQACTDQIPTLALQLSAFAAQRTLDVTNCLIGAEYEYRRISVMPALKANSTPYNYRETSYSCL
uniref:Uncharacterized protein n=1 Tax=Timema cristinae TaxID=61476 RepID=A0A7R9D6D6_TIMCR|nr:unnamed protein product [Timema cristinae]